jgi:hypothetical protein
MVIVSRILMKGCGKCDDNEHLAAMTTLPQVSSLLAAAFHIIPSVAPYDVGEKLVLERST